MTPEVSVVLPYRDAGSTIEEAIESTLDQPGVGLELIAVDDGSGDDGPERVAKLAARHRAIVLVEGGGVGIARALELGRAQARAPLLARMDGDDVCLPDRLRAEVELMRSDATLGLVATQVVSFPDELVGDGLRRYVAWQNSLLTAEDHARELFVESPVCHPSVLLRREALDAVGGWRDLPWPEDYDLWLRLDAAGFRMAKVPEVLLRWRHHQRRATLTDGRYGLEAFRACKAPHLARRLRDDGRPVAVWGAGRTGKRLVRLLELEGVRAERFIDVDPKKIGGVARGAPIVGPDRVPKKSHLIVVAAGAIGARALIREALEAAGLREGDDYLCAA